MADPTPDQEDPASKATRWLKAKTRNPMSCTACGNKTFGVSDPVKMPAAMSYIDDLEFTAVPVICQNCGLTLFFHAKPMGIVVD